MHRTPQRLWPAAPILLALAAICTFAALLAGPAAASIVPPPYDQSDTFWSWPGSVLLHVSVTPAESSAGYVVSDPYYIDCPFACTRPYDVGAKVTLTANPTHGFAFTGWNGDACAGQGNPCTLTMTADTIVTADFSGHYVPVAPPTTTSGTSKLTVGISAYEPYSFVTSDKGGIDCWDFGVSGTCSATYPTGTTVTLTATPFIAAFFVEWFGSVNSLFSPLSITMNGNKTVTASFGSYCLC